MNHYRNLVNFIDSVISDNARRTIGGYTLDFNKLNSDDQQQIAALFIESDDRDLFSIYENEKYDDIVSSLLGLLKRDTLETAKDFSTCIKTSLVDYYAKKAQELIDERLELIDFEKDPDELRDYEARVHVAARAAQC